jgi:hypothetical protein
LEKSQPLPAIPEAIPLPRALHREQRQEREADTSSTKVKLTPLPKVSYNLPFNTNLDSIFNSAQFNIANCFTHNELNSKNFLFANNFSGGCIKNFINEWQLLTSDREILQTVNGYVIEFFANPLQHSLPRFINFSQTEINVINNEIDYLCQKGIITPCDREKGDYLSSIFLRPKKNGSYRLILNLSKLNEYIVYHHFKMESLIDATSKITPNCWMCSIDL